MKTIVILADGMRPDALEGIGKAEDILAPMAAHFLFNLLNLALCLFFPELTGN